MARDKNRWRSTLYSRIDAEEGRLRLNAEAKKAARKNKELPLTNVQRLERHSANDYWLQLCHSIQTFAVTGNVKGMYDGIRKALGPSKKHTEPLKSVTGELIHDIAKQIERLVEYYA